jgi:hypothetical protein
LATAFKIRHHPSVKDRQTSLIKEIESRGRRKKESRTSGRTTPLTFLEMAFRTDRRERLEKPDGYGKKTGNCGDTVEFFINLDGEPHPHPRLRHQRLP